MTEMSERDVTPEEQAEMAVAEWLRIGCGKGLGDIPHDQLRAWDDACEGVQLQADKQIAAGWIRVERSLVDYVDLGGAQVTPEEFTPIVDILVGAKERFRMAQTKSRTEVQKAQAILAEGSVDYYMYLMLGIPGTPATANYYMQMQLEALKRAENYARRENRDFNPEEIQKLHSIATITAVNYNNGNLVTALQGSRSGVDSLSDLSAKSSIELPTTVRVGRRRQGKRYIALPPFSRFNEGSVKDRWNVLLWDVVGDPDDPYLKLYPARVGQTHRPGVITIPPEALKLGKFTRQSKHDALPAFRSAILDKRVAGALVPAKLHANGITGAVMDAIDSQVVNIEPMGFAEVETPDAPLEWYSEFSPHQNPFSKSETEAQATELLNVLETSYAAGEIEPDHLVLLGYLHLEQAESLAGSPAGSFDRAEDVLAAAAEKFFDRRDNITAYQMLTAKAAIPLRRAIAERSENLEEARKEYCGWLANISEAILEYTAGDDELTDEALPLLRQIAVSLLATNDETASYIVTPTLPRQQNKGGWDLAIFPETTGGEFDLRYQGRLRLSDQRDEQSLMYGIGTLSHSVLRMQTAEQTKETVLALLDHINEEEAPEITLDAFRRAMQSIATAGLSAEMY